MSEASHREGHGAAGGHHEHEADIHLHEHAHGGVTHRHPHYHPPVAHVHEPAGEHLHEHAAADPARAHRHSHAYAFELYAYADSALHRLDARTKTLALFGLILAVVLTPASELWRFALFGVGIAGLYLVAGVPLTFGVKRSLVVVPFVLFAGALLVFMPDRPHPDVYELGFARVDIGHGGLYMLAGALIKSWLSVITAILLYSTTPFPKFVKGLESLRVPRVITMLFSFLYRFMWILVDEVKRMVRARDARAFGGSRTWHLRVIGQMIGSLFLRSYERAERVYAAMAARGYDGTIKTLDASALTWRDAVFSLLFFTMLAIVMFGRI